MLPVSDSANPPQKVVSTLKECHSNKQILNQVLNSAVTIVVQPANAKDILEEHVLSEERQQSEEGGSSIVSLADKPVTQPSSVGKYFCHLCSFSASEKEPMVDHLDVHNIDYFFTCARCPGKNYKKSMMGHIRDSHPGGLSDLCSLVDETKFFEFKPLDDTSSDESLVCTVPPRPRQNSVPVNMVRPMIAGQALHSTVDTDVLNHEAPLPASSQPAPSVLPARFMPSSLTEDISLPLPLLMHCAPLQQETRTHSLPLSRGPAHLHYPQDIPKEPTPLMEDLTTNADEFGVSPTVQQLPDEESEAKKIASICHVTPHRPPVQSNPSPPVSQADPGHHKCPCCPVITISKDDLRQHMLTHEPDMQLICPYCPAYNQMPLTSLENHIRLIHPGQAICYLPSGV
ncbi:hypothetical protein CAPTEDRAFT_191606 [Capitella teleta]|uniref:C2H2-type domain-containing protein n=1 Tax=Capitella teleta TaxID=283909 RepID=R7UUA5_CAPTE|nr:hypothetical protein CAPTEDRAFT_191606 [Capitella teleta]|eukprot:ELU09775.1 hypothetical protein CAPTEDRAFT_191606 [Capitella teleta]